MTKKLFLTLIVLILLLITYVTVIKFDVIMNGITTFINELTNNVIIPENVSEYKRTYNYSTFKNTEDFVPKNKDDIKNILYTILNSGWNDFTFYCPKEYPTCSSDIKEIANDDNFISLMNNYVSPYNSFINFNTVITGNKTIYVTIDKLYTEDEINKTNESINYIIYKLINNKVNANYNDIKSLHDYILSKTVYDKNYKDGNYFTNSNKTIGVLFDGSAICSGYADTMAVILDKLNIPNIKVSSENHVWNAAYIDGKWLHIDATWDDDEKNSNNRKNFFLITSQRLYELDVTEHTFNKDLYLELQ